MGLTFNDIIYQQLISQEQVRNLKSREQEPLELIVNQAYQTGIIAIDISSFSLTGQKDDNSKSEEDEEFSNKQAAPYDYVAHQIELYQEFVNIPESNRNVHVEEYLGGDECAVDGKKRRIKVFYYCDSYAAYQSIDNDNVGENGLNDEEWQRMMAKHTGIKNDKN